MGHDDEVKASRPHEDGVGRDRSSSCKRQSWMQAWYRQEVIKRRLLYHFPNWCSPLIFLGKVSNVTYRKKKSRITVQSHTHRNPTLYRSVKGISLRTDVGGQLLIYLLKKPARLRRKRRCQDSQEGGWEQGPRVFRMLCSKPPHGHRPPQQQS